MLAETVRREANRIKAKYHTADPYEICRVMKISIQMTPMGTGAKSCKGFFLIQSRCKVITINSDLPENIQRIILVHELGHAILHSSPALSAFHEFDLFDKANRLEYEANIFSAEFMLEDTEVVEALKEENEFFRAAQILGVPPELLDFKLRIMSNIDFKVTAPIVAHGDYLKRDLSRPLY